MPKGSLKADTLDVLEAAGLDVSELRDPGRHLIVRGRDTRAGEGAVGDIEFVIVRPSDAPAFVGCGGADCGICGWDSLIEADLNLLQLVDLGYGLCTFIEAEPRGAPARPSATMPAAGRFAWLPSIRASRAPGMPSAV